MTPPLTDDEQDAFAKLRECLNHPAATSYVTLGRLACERLLSGGNRMAIEIDRLRDTNSKLNRRAQQADAAVADAQRVIAKITEGSKHGTPWVGGSLGRAFLAYGYSQQEKRIAELEAELELERARADCAKSALDRMCRIVTVGPKQETGQ